MNFKYSLQGPTGTFGLYSPNNSLDILCDSKSLFLFNTDSLENYKTELTLIITNKNGNHEILVNFLDNRVINNESFGFIPENSNSIFYGEFSRGSYGVVLCSFEF